MNVKEKCYPDIRTMKGILFLLHLNYCAEITHFNLDRHLSPYIHSCLPSKWRLQWHRTGMHLALSVKPQSSTSLEQYPIFGHMHIKLCLFLLWHIPSSTMIIKFYFQLGGKENKVPWILGMSQQDVLNESRPTASAPWRLHSSHCFQAGIPLLLPRTPMPSCFIINKLTLCII